jgi:hypothetical protein
VYVIQSKACSVPNSATPIPATAIQASVQSMDQVNSQVSKALAAFTSLVTRKDLNAAGIQTNNGNSATASEVRSFDSSPVPPSSAVEALKTFPTMCQGRSVAPTSFKDPSPCYGDGSEVPDMLPLTVPPVGVQPSQPKPRPQSGSSIALAALGLGALWLIFGKGGR